MTPRVLALPALVLLAVACSGPPPASPATTTSAPASASASAESPAPADTVIPEPPPVATASAKPELLPPSDSGDPRERLMRNHFNETALIRTAVINGALSEAIAPASALAKMDGLGSVKASWQPSIEALQSASRKFTQTPDISGAAALVADIGLACGSCHRVAGGPKLTLGSPPPAADTSVKTRMKRHIWAVERLWEGVYAPSDASWKAGVDALAGDQFPKEVLDKGGVHARSAATRFTTLVAGAGTKKKAEERGALYASLLGTCSSCHLTAREKK